MQYENKDPNEVVPRGYDFTAEIANFSPGGDTIVSQSVVASPSDMTVSKIGLDPNVPGRVTFELSGGSVGTSSSQTYTLTITATLLSGYIIIRQVKQPVKVGGNS